MMDAELIAEFMRTRLYERSGNRGNQGYMHDDHTSQGCAERYLGVVH
jgi:hypothetical protein